MDITESKFFFIGAADGEQYGLYEPVSNRFVLTSKFSQSLLTVAKLFASKLSLRVCKLDKASNFSQNLLDNTCCTNWTIKYSPDLRLKHSLLDNTTASIYTVKELVPSKPIENELIVNNIEFLMAAYQWTTIEEYKTALALNDSFAVTENDMRCLIDFPGEFSNYTQKIMRINKVIFSEFDLESAESEVNKIINE